ncbi:ankyrin repeat domain-containing protein [Burkholderia pseudomallei]|uniref:ankyrin repeat domain-containing protein n=1 Tax=Burkholderia pseudomallei TaxID=28450 RepID=UPI0021F6E1AE|nr:ankyrin repeat domain-containing protein [Burkholderia pseudomallei]MCW0163768.1 ankyrin repeat domain-containing protein [Burkholderia pseudomallei]
MATPIRTLGTPYAHRSIDSIAVQASAARSVSIPMPPHGVPYDYYAAAYLLAVQTANQRGAVLALDLVRKAYTVDLLGMVLLGDIAGGDMVEVRETLSSPLAVEHLHRVRYHQDDQDGAFVGLKDLTPLHVVAMHGLAMVVRPLLKAGVNPRARTSCGKTARDLAERRGHHAVVKALIGLGE